MPRKEVEIGMKKIDRIALKNLLIYKCLFLVSFAFLGFFCNAAISYSQETSIDYRYSPAYWHSAIGFPGDYHKTLVNESGSLLYDFGPGPYVRPNTVISFSLVFISS